jgi:hypothetical protein
VFIRKDWVIRHLYDHAHVCIILQSKKYMYWHDCFISFRFLWSLARICYHTYCVNIYTTWPKSSQRNFIPVVRYPNIFLPCMNLNALILFAIKVECRFFRLLGRPRKLADSCYVKQHLLWWDIASISLGSNRFTSCEPSERGVQDNFFWNRLQF